MEFHFWCSVHENVSLKVTAAGLSWKKKCLCHSESPADLSQTTQKDPIPYYRLILSGSVHTVIRLNMQRTDSMPLKEMLFFLQCAAVI